MMRSLYLLPGALLTLIFLGAVGCSETWERKEDDIRGRLSPPEQEGPPSELVDDVNVATAVYRSLVFDAPDRAVPQDLLASTECIAVIPNTIKAAFIVGGHHGKGIASCRISSDRWSAPSFVSMTGASVGFQYGAESTDMVIFFTNNDAREILSQPDLRLGADVQATAGPIGRHLQASTGRYLEGAYTYARSKGAFLGASLDGARLSPDDEANAAFYSRAGITADELLSGRTVNLPQSAQEFVRALT